MKTFKILKEELIQSQKTIDHIARQNLNYPVIINKVLDHNNTHSSTLRHIYNYSLNKPNHIGLSYIKDIAKHKNADHSLL